MIRKLSGIVTMLVTVGVLFNLSACEDNLAHYKPFSPLPQEEKGSELKIDKEFPIKSLIQASRLNIIWVIDNSGSMDMYQKAVIKNSASFMQLFDAKKLDWKMGLLSTDADQDSFIGFKPDQPLNSSMPSGVFDFIVAVATLGTSGSGYEETLRPIVNELKEFPDFIDDGASVALIFVTDAEEQSPENGEYWLNEFLPLVKNATNVFGYGVFAAKDFGCRSDEGEWFYENSEYKPFLEGLTAHKTLKLCDPDFGRVLSNIGDDLLRRIAYYSIPLPFRPKQETIVVTHKGVPLKAGPQETGGIWFYDYAKNAITLYDLTFAEGENESIHVYAEEDDGLAE